MNTTRPYDQGLPEIGRGESEGDTIESSLIAIHRAQDAEGTWRHDALRFITNTKDLLEGLPVYGESEISDLIRRAALLLTPGADEKGKP